MITYGKKGQSESSAPTEDTILNAPLQRPLQPDQDLPQLSLGASDYVEKSIPPTTIKRRNSANECYSIIGFLSRKVKGTRDRWMSQDLMWRQIEGQQPPSPNGGIS